MTMKKLSTILRITLLIAILPFTVLGHGPGGGSGGGPGTSAGGGMGPGSGGSGESGPGSGMGSV